MKPLNFVMWVVPLFWALGGGAIMSYWFQTPFFEVTMLLYFGFLFAGELAVAMST